MTETMTAPLIVTVAPPTCTCDHGIIDLPDGGGKVPGDFPGGAGGHGAGQK